MGASGVEGGSQGPIHLPLIYSPVRMWARRGGSKGGGRGWRLVDEN